MLEDLGGLGMVEDLLERAVHTLRLADLLDRAAVVAGIRGRRLLGAEDEGANGRVSITSTRVSGRSGLGNA